MHTFSIVLCCIIQVPTTKLLLLHMNRKKTNIWQQSTNPDSTPPVGHRRIWVARSQLAVVATGGPPVAANCDLAPVAHPRCAIWEDTKLDYVVYIFIFTFTHPLKQNSTKTSPGMLRYCLERQKK